MPGPEQSLAAFGGPLLGYGPAPGVELIPYFLGLLAWVGLALSAILLSPLLALFRRLRRAWGALRGRPTDEPPPAAPKAPAAGRHDSA